MDVPIDAPACRPRALVYRGPAGHGDLSEAVAQLLESSPRRFEVQYAGPKEAVDVTRESLASVELYAQPGGPGMYILCILICQVKGLQYRVYEVVLDAHMAKLCFITSSLCMHGGRQT